jgi:hemoglobin
MTKKPGTIYKAIGGQAAVDRIIDALYKHIGKNETLLPIFPRNLQESARKQRLFLTQLFGGPELYLQNRGYPMLQKRHRGLKITPERRDAWLACMDLALKEAQIEEPYRTAIFDRMVFTAHQIAGTLENKAN